MSEGWHVRQAGRQSGPFDLERLRTMAQRGALTRFHQLSRDGEEWISAAKVRAVFNEDGSVATGPTDSGASFSSTSAFEAFANMRMPELPALPTAHFRGGAFGATVLWAQIAALALGTLAMVAPTSRDADGALQWWFQEGALSISVHAMTLLAFLTWWVVAFLPPNASVGASLAAVSAVLAAGSMLPAVSWAPWALPAAAVLPLAAMLVAFSTEGSKAVGAVAITLCIEAGLALVVAGLLLAFNFSGWGLAAVLVQLAGTVALIIGAVRTKSGLSHAFALTVGGAAAMAVTMFLASAAALAGEQPAHGAAGATSAALCVCLSVLAWSASHQALGGPLIIKSTTES